MIASFPELLARARDRGLPLAGFSCYDLVQAQGVLDAAEAVDADVLILLPTAAFRARRGEALVAALNGAAAAASVPACVQIDHAPNLDTIRAALAAGAAAAMVDGSELPFAENLRFVAAAVAIAADADAAIECELGGDGAEQRQRTDPELARRLLDETGAACLAVAVGNAHGRYRSPPRLDLERLAEVKSAVGGRALSLHGASGIPGEQLRLAAAAGITKVNVNTELRERYLAAIRATSGELARLGNRHGSPTIAIERLRETTRAGASAVFARLARS
jgi:tagatose 1,6-diphosphate aldolase GatY/KbaY